VSWHKKTIGARIAFGSVNAGAVLVEVQVDFNSAGGTLEEVEVGGGSDAREGLCIGSRGGGGEKGEEGDEGGDGEGPHGGGGEWVGMVR
jgi:hypothetical protein